MSEEKSFTVIFKYAPGHHSYPVMARNEEAAKNLCYSAFGIENITVVRVENTEEAKIAKSKVYKRAVKMKATPKELQKVANYIEGKLK